MTQDEKIDLILRTHATMLKMITNLATELSKWRLGGLPEDEAVHLEAINEPLRPRSLPAISEIAIAAALTGRLSVAPELNQGLAHEDQLILCKGCGMLWQQKDVESWGELRPVADVAHGGELESCANCDNRLMLKLTAERVLSSPGAKP